MLKILKFNSKSSLKTLEIFLNKRKFIQNNRTSEVSKIIDNVKKRSRPICDGYEGLEVLRQAIQAKNDAA